MLDPKSQAEEIKRKYWFLLGPHGFSAYQQQRANRVQQRAMAASARANDNRKRGVGPMRWGSSRSMRAKMRMLTAPTKREKGIMQGKKE